MPSKLLASSRTERTSFPLVTHGSSVMCIVVVDFGWFFQKIHLGKHFSRLSARLMDFFTVKGFEFGDNLLLMADLLLLV